MNYREYLKSDHWKQVKAEKVKTVPKRCSICASTIRVQLHHLFYRHPWTDVQLSDTRWLCDRCHKLAHDLMKSGVLKFPRPDNHHSCFALTKFAVKKHLGITNKNMFYPDKNA